MMALGQRVKQERLALGWTQERLAQESGLDPESGRKTIQVLEARDSARSRYAGAFAKAMGLRLEYLVDGTEPKREAPLFTSRESPSNNHTVTEPLKNYVLGSLMGWDDSTPLDDDDVEVPLYKEIQISGGRGRAIHTVELTELKLRFSYSTMRKAGVDPANAACATLRDRSMERLIMDGSSIGIDRGRTQVKDGRIFAIDHNGELRAKYLYNLPKGGLRLRSENSAEYPDEFFEAGWEQQIRVLGWVFWWSRLEVW